ncbi:MAG: YqcC family protein [Burkholderiales bacterium]
MDAVLDKVRAIELEMRRIGYWSDAPSQPVDSTKLYGGVSFEQWLQFAFLPSISAAARSDDFSEVPSYRVGLAAFRQYDYHSTIEDAFPLMHLCQDLENLLANKLPRCG